MHVCTDSRNRPYTINYFNPFCFLRGPTKGCSSKRGIISKAWKQCEYGFRAHVFLSEGRHKAGGLAKLQQPTVICWGNDLAAGRIRNLEQFSGSGGGQGEWVAGVSLVQYQPLPPACSLRLPLQLSLYLYRIRKWGTRSKALIGNVVREVMMKYLTCFSNTRSEHASGDRI